MMSLKIRLLTFIVESLIRYQRHLETQQWLKAQRQQRWRVEGLNIHIAKDIGADADGRFRTKLDQVERPERRERAKRRVNLKAWRIRQRPLKIRT
ncbi:MULTISPECIES: hypothetical protein [unclassified Agarivorans]|uniref:hypothetical protein n=1 Tax=unclassified Agarivorans TaxID=2636026 RepID=UPI003D7EF2E4